ASTRPAPGAKRRALGAGQLLEGVQQPVLFQTATERLDGEEIGGRDVDEVHVRSRQSSTGGPEFQEMHSCERRVRGRAVGDPALQAVTSFMAPRSRNPYLKALRGQAESLALPFLSRGQSLRVTLSPPGETISSQVLRRPLIRQNL